MSIPVQIDGFAQAFLKGKRMEAQYLDIGYERLLPFRSASRPGATSLIVTFHGAVNRNERKYPSFGPYVQGVGKHAHQIAFADPTLALSEEISIAWFAGSKELPLQDVLGPVIQRLKDDLNVTQLVFVGGSGGGFAALYFSWHFPGSVAVAFSPQTIIANYSKDRLALFSKAAWPDVSESSKKFPILDLRDMYGASIPNNVVYLQSQGDHTHLYRQMAPFLAAIPRDFYDRVVTKTSYWGKSGHPGSVPLTEVDAWVQAVLSVETPTAINVRDEFHMRWGETPHLQNRVPGKEPKTSSNRNSDNGVSTGHYHWSERIAREALRQEEN